MMFALGKAIARISSARFPSGPLDGFVDAVRTLGIATRDNAASVNSVWPAGNLPAWSTYATSSIDCFRERLPGRLKGIVFSILSTRFASDRPLQLERKLSPTSGGPLV